VIPVTILIAYFSWKGHTETVVKSVTGYLPDAELVRIVPARTINIAAAGMKAFFGMRSAIKPVKADLSGIDTLVVASPVWAGKVPPFVNEYLESLTGGTGKPFHVIVEMGGRGDQGAIAAVRTRLERKGMKFISSASTIEKDVDAGTFTGTVGSFAAGIR